MDNKGIKHSRSKAEGLGISHWKGNKIRIKADFQLSEGMAK